MNSKITKYILITLTSILLPLISISQNTNWPNYRGNQQLQGFTENNIPLEFDILWTFKTEDEVKSSPIIVDDKIYFTSTDAHVYCLNMTGELIWKFNTKNSIEASPTVVDSIVYVGNLSGEFFAFNRFNGKVKWTYKAENQIMGAPNYYEESGKQYILIGSYDYYLHCIDGLTGKLVWKYELNNFLNSAVAVDNGKAIFGGCDGFLHMVDIKTGKLHHKMEIATYIAGSPAMENGTAYVGDYEGFFFSINMNTKKVNWKYKNKASDLAFIASPSIYKEYVISCSRDKHTYCYNKSTGKLIWKRNSGFRMDASPLVSSNHVLIVNMRGDIQILDINKGEVITTYEIGSPVFSNPAVYKGKIVLGAMDGNIYCLGK